MVLFIALIVVSIALVVIGIGVKGLLWLSAVGALLLLATLVFYAVSGRTG